MEYIYVLIIQNNSVACPVAWNEHRAPLIEYAEKQKVDYYIVKVCKI